MVSTENGGQYAKNLKIFDKVKRIMIIETLKQFSVSKLIAFFKKLCFISSIIKFLY